MKQNNGRKWITLILLAVFLGSSAMMFQLINEQRMAQQAYDQAAQLAAADQDKEPEAPKPVEIPEDPSPAVEIPEAPEVPEEPEVPEAALELMDTDLESLRQVNGDVLGWFCIPDSGMSYPLMRSHDNNEYLTLTWDKQWNKSGSIFLECQNNPELTDFHTLIYGHNLVNDLMFSELVNYQSQAYFDAHPYVYLVMDDTVLEYSVFSAYTANVVSDTYRLYFEDDARKQSAIDFYIEKNEMESEVIPTIDDQILTLSTCTGNGDARQGVRWVVQTVLTAAYPR